MSRTLLYFATLLTILLTGCGQPLPVPVGPSGRPRFVGKSSSESSAPGSAETAVNAQEALQKALSGRDDLPPERRALLLVDGKERWVDARAIASVGYTLVDLRDTWTPLLFREEHTAQGEPLPNRYRRVFLGLANDQLDNDGVALEPGRKNYLELYGIFPSLSVLRARFLKSAEGACHDPERVEVLSAVETVSLIAPEKVERENQRFINTRAELEKDRKRSKVKTLAELGERRPALRRKIEFVERRAAEKLAMTAAEQRLRCEEMFSSEHRHKPGVYDEAMRLAVRRFQQKNMVYEANFLRRRTVEALARPPLDNDYDSLVRAIRERVISAAAIIEDGTARTAEGAGPDLAGEYTKLALEQLGLTDVQAALAFFQRHEAAEFKTLVAAIKLPPRPAYYAQHMELSIVVDRGDVWYDLPFDASGQFALPSRKHYPTLTLQVTHEGKTIALARWRTTIGGWRLEQAPNGYEYYRYKMSDVGPRVIRQVVSGPVWIAPTSTPTRALTKGKKVNGSVMRVVNYDELGPGYLSAYGIVAGYFVIPGLNGRPDNDKGVRAHGSSDYLSIYTPNGYSHGCHRLPNYVAVRLYSFILGHRRKVIAGDQSMTFSRQFLYDDTVYEMRIPSRGYAYYLDPPLPVEVLKGNIKGPQKTPIIGYMPKPNESYPPGPPPPTPDSPEAKTGGGEGATPSAPESSEAKPGGDGDAFP